MKKIVSVFLAVSMCLSILCVASITSEATTYKYGVALGNSSVKLGAGESYTVSVKTNNNYAFTCYDVIPEGNCVDLTSWNTSSNGYFKVKAKTSHWLNGDYVGVISKKYTSGYSRYELESNGTRYLTDRSSYCTFSVYNAPSSIKLNKTSITLKVGQSYTLTESTNSGSYANNQNLKWTSSNTSVAKVSKGSGNKGIVKAVKKGTATITIKTYNGKTATCKVTVK